MHNIRKIICILSLAGCCIIQSVLAADEWVLKSDSFTLSRQSLNSVLEARGFDVKALPAEHKQALLQELFIRESLLAQQAQIPASVMLAFEEKLADYRRGQLAKLTLDVLSEEGMPDFSKRARELYDIRKNDQYQLPLRLRVRILRQSLERPAIKRVSNGEDEQYGVAHLQALLARIHAGELDFKQAVLQYSDDPTRKLNGGDSFWFQQGQKPEVIFTAAAKLNTKNNISNIIANDKFAYILQFIGRKEATQQAFAEVKGDIVKELQTEYRNEQRKLLLTQLRERFQNDAEIHPDFHN